MQLQLAVHMESIMIYSSISYYGSSRYWHALILDRKVRRRVFVHGESIDGEEIFLRKVIQCEVIQGSGWSDTKGSTVSILGHHHHALTALAELDRWNDLEVKVIPCKHARLCLPNRIMRFPRRIVLDSIWLWDESCLNISRHGDPWSVITSACLSGVECRWVQLSIVVGGLVKWVGGGCERTRDGR